MDKQSARKSILGFTLVELMIVLVIMGIVCAIAVPGIIEVRYRNILIETVNNVQVAATQARSLALQTRRAAVLEFRQDRVWVNLLQGSECDSYLGKVCISNTGTIGNGAVLIYDTIAGTDWSFAKEAGVGMCLGAARGLQDVGDGDDPYTGNDCPTAPIELLSANGFAICYSGRGNLYVRSVLDDLTECPASADGDTDIDTDTDTDADTDTDTDTSTGQVGDFTWFRTCSASDSAAVIDNNLKLYDGVVVIFNRFENDNCQGNKLDVRRGLFFPTTGAPYSKLAP